LYLIDFKCNANGKWSYPKMKDIPGELTLPVPDDHEQVTLKQLEVTKARKALGSMSRRDGKETDNVKIFHDKTSSLADHVRTGHLRPDDAWHALKSTILKGIEYSLMSTCLTAQQCRHIMSPALMAGLPASKIQPRLPRDLVYGPISAQGLGIPFIHTTQTLKHILACLRHAHHDTLTGQLLRSSSKALILNLGSPIPVWNLEYHLWEPIVTDSWLKATWRDLRLQNLYLEDTITRPKLKRPQDIFLMDAFVAAGYRKGDLHALKWCRMYLQALRFKGDLHALKWCRMYLQALRLSDISNAAGTRLCEASWDCQPRQDWEAQYNWPKNTRPNASARAIWQEATRGCFLHGGRGRNLSLRNPLGHWSDASDTEWKWFISPGKDRLYCHEEGQWSIWRRLITCT
jgi:hypothetical protein